MHGNPPNMNILQKAVLGSISMHGGAKPWESKLLYDAMQRSGKQLGVSNLNS